MHQYVFMDLNVSCSGYLQAVTLFTLGTGEFYLDVWTLLPDDYALLLTTQLINVTTAGLNMFDLPNVCKSDKIHLYIFIQCTVVWAVLGALPHVNKRSSRILQCL